MIAINRVTPEDITTLKPHEVFVFGSNEGGRHSKGAALTAQRWGAIKSVPNGRAGQTYAIPTKPHDVRARLTLKEIAIYVRQFVTHAKTNQDSVFLVTAIGCGLAGYAAKDIAPMFTECVEMANVKLPLTFWQVLFRR